MQAQATRSPGATRAGIVALAVGMGKWFSIGALAVCGVLLGVLASGCGGSERNAREVRGVYTVEVLRGRFPARQQIASDTRLALIVRNTGAKTIPNVAVTLDSFYYTSTYPKLSSRKRPVWIVNTGPSTNLIGPPVQSEEVNPPGGGETAFVNTWALGALAPGKSKRFIWKVTPVKAGLHVVHYTVEAGLDGKALARLASGRRAVGAFVAVIAPRPKPTHVNPETGKVEQGPTPTPVAPQPAAP
ncbi:MAG TPA: hypothetical protein VNX67_10015 [Solirubrobacteraceae bacterium]|nr:hypothetical protein [Solirubrobacteraceae bacterium]